VVVVAEDEEAGVVLLVQRTAAQVFRQPNRQEVVEVVALRKLLLGVPVEMMNRKMIHWLSTTMMTIINQFVEKVGVEGEEVLPEVTVAAAVEELDDHA